MFTAEHFIWMALSAVFIVGMTIISVKGRWSLRRAGYVMTAICAFSEISKMMSDMQANPAGGMSLDPRSLPFHLCSLMLFGVLYITFGREGRARQWVIDFLAVIGDAGELFCPADPHQRHGFPDDLRLPVLRVPRGAYVVLPVSDFVEKGGAGREDPAAESGDIAGAELHHDLHKRRPVGLRDELHVPCAAAYGEPAVSEPR